ncbi:50S ribosomal protein L4 [Patescibacteria group bacterium]|nr:50S ribosomal protein L4 [Patescibacteria group bacterium]
MPTKTTKKPAAKLSVKILDTKGQAQDDLDLTTYYPKKEIADGYNQNFVHQVLLTYLNNQRQATSKVKTKSEVQGGGRKPWRQKGTGRARHGSIRSPLWRSGGVTFGPTGQENYYSKLNRKAKQQAMRYALHALLNNNQLIVIDEFTPVDSTKKLAQFLSQFPLTTSNLLVLDQKSLTFAPFADNIPDITVKSHLLVNPLDIFQCQTMMCTKSALQDILKRIKSPN